MLRGLTIALATVVAVAVTAGVAAAGVVSNDVNQTVPFIVFVPCANGGAGELVSGTIDYHTIVTSTINGNNVSGKFHTNPQGSDIVGAVTGDVYNAVGVTQENFKGSLQNGQFTQTFVNNFRIIGQGQASNYLVHQNTHVTINANGDVTVTHDNTSVDCK